MRTRRPRPFWSLGYREARGHAVILAVILWLVAAVFVIGWPGSHDYVGTLKGADFVHFYTLGNAALVGDAARLHDGPALYASQVALVPASSGDVFLPVYPPQTAVVFAAFALLPYGLAAVLWALVTVAVYGGAVRAAWMRARQVFPDGWFVVAAAAAFPPFWNLVLHGQTTAIPLSGFTLGWLALERRRPFAAGLAFGLLAIKPQFGLVLAVVVLSGREWRMLAGAVTSAFLQAAAAAAVFGSQALTDYVALIRRLPEFAPALEPRPYQLHSIAALTQLLPAWSGALVWAAASAAVAFGAVRAWRSDAPLVVRLAVLVLASVLVNPHLTIYDATVLALPVLWLGGWVHQPDRRDVMPAFWPAVYLLFVTLLVPTAFFVWVQASVFVTGWLFVMSARAARTGYSPTTR